MSATIALEKAPRGLRRVPFVLVTIVKYMTGIILCLTPLTALIVLGWLNRKMAGDIERRRLGQRLAPWPNFIVADEKSSSGHWYRLIGALVTNLRWGIRAWFGVLVLTLPFSLIWFASWFAGWENSFSKGYELSGIWPLVSLAAIAVSVPILIYLPMAIAHQGVVGRLAAIFSFRRIVALIRSAGWSYVVLSVLISLGCIGILGVRALPVFAEQFSDRVAGGSPQAIKEFASQYRLGMTVLLFTGLLIMRHVMARVYARASLRHENGKRAGRIKFSLILLLTGLLYLASVLLIYVAQFVNYSWWSWLNQPVLMLPWIGII